MFLIYDCKLITSTTGAFKGTLNPYFNLKAHIFTAAVTSCATVPCCAAINFHLGSRSIRAPSVKDNDCIILTTVICFNELFN